MCDNPRSRLELFTLIEGIECVDDATKFCICTELIYPAGFTAPVVLA